MKTDWINSKILTLESLEKKIATWRLNAKKIVFTNGCFDILHRGHLELIKTAAESGDYLVVGLNTDASVKRLKGAERPINNEFDRSFQMASLLMVDAVCLFEEDTPLNMIKKILPDVLVKGGDYTVAQIIGAEAVIEIGGEVQIIPFVQGYSTTGIIEQIRRL